MSHGPVILNQIGPWVTDALARHPSRPSVLEAASGTPPWQVGGADILLTRPSGSWEEAPREAPLGWPGRLRWVQVASAGVDWFPRWLSQGTVLTCGRGHSAAPVADYGLASILLREKPLDQARATTGASWRQHTLGTMEGCVLGLAGFGAIGQAVAARAASFGMRVLTWRRTPVAPAGVETVTSLAALAAHSDHLVLALPLTPATRHCVDAAVLSAAKPGLHLVNIAPGGLVDQAALLAALDRGQGGFASLDVTEPEPLADDHPFYRHPQVRLTPHIAWSGGATQQRLAAQIIDNLERFADGRALRDVFDPAAGY